MFETINYWLLLPEMWLIAGIVLIVAELLLGTAYFLLALGVASLIFSGLAFLQEKELVNFLTDWMDIAVVYGLLTLVSIFLLRFFVQDKTKSEDINKY
jgi:membrane protein implicated in regulation of membrane protease activity